jgi:Uma2 family endonuclease
MPVNPIEIDDATETSCASWLPSPDSLYRLSIEKYEAMVASGLFTRHDRFHLIDGLLVAKMIADPPHCAASDATRMHIESLLPSGWHVRNDRPLRIWNGASVPEPDLVVAREIIWDYQDRHPEPADVALIVEIASTSLYEDRGMAQIYGAGGIPMYWIVNLNDRRVEVHSDRGPKGYQSHRIHSEDQSVPLVIDGRELGQIPVSDMLPRRR